jgi:hypothetical protein
MGVAQNREDNFPEGRRPSAHQPAQPETFWAKLRRGDDARSTLLRQDVFLNCVDGLKIRSHNVTVGNLYVAVELKQGDEIYQRKTVEHAGLEKVIAGARRRNTGDGRAVCQEVRY